MTRPALVANLLTLLAFPIPSAAAPAVPAVVPQHGDGETPNPAPVVRVHAKMAGIGLVALQVLAGYAVGIGGMAGLIEAGVYPKQIGIRSDMANVAYVALLAPALVSVGVCGTGYLSRRYNGRCSTTLLGAYTGAAVGTVLGFLMAPAPGPDSSAEFSSAAAAILGAALLTPIGAVAGWHIGKQEIAQPALGAAAPALVGAQPAMLASLPSRSLMFPVLSLRW